MTRQELARLRSALDNITAGPNERHRRRGVVAIQELIDETQRELDAAERQNYRFGELVAVGPV
jgi:hypothetical protein